EAADARFGLFDSVAGLFTRYARDTPLLIILDDLHWADSASVQLLDFVARQCAAERVLLLGAYRNDETAVALLELRGQVLQLDGLTRALDLTSDSAADLLDEAVRARVVVVADDAGAHFAHDLFRETILAQLSSARRAALHATIGRALQTLSGGARHHDRAEVGATARLAAHFVAAGPTLAAEALDYSVLAAQEEIGRAHV